MLTRPNRPPDVTLTLFPAASNAYAPAGTSRYASEAATPGPPSRILPLLYPHHLPCLLSCRTLKIFLQRFHPMSTLTHPHASAPLPYLLCSLPSLLSHIILIRYGGLFAYSSNTEIC
ncbi:hypothetical protein O181_048303 [Austropuccinia psidii MF-1]|uniref:Uncharacterized protein n=1 Tax=Austropuccinia psidii MF-1 TaxID=1389203 RepID=A0A9Q3DXS1_9BASI|nr:hypothetical protein [Austropuccinia psidii MF-1]